MVKYRKSLTRVLALAKVILGQGTKLWCLNVYFCTTCLEALAIKAVHPKIVSSPTHCTVLV